MTTTSATPMTGQQWKSANSRYLAAEMARLRLLLHRRVLWLRTHWNRDSQQTTYANWAISDHEADVLLVGCNSNAEQDFYCSDSEAVTITAQLEDLAADLAEQRQEMGLAGSQPAIDAVAARFGLSPFERDVLLLCLSVELDPAFERILGYVHDDATRKAVSPYLAIALLSDTESGETARASLLASAPLRRWRLISADTASGGSTASAAALRVDERVVNYLLGINHLDQRCLEFVHDAPLSPLALSQRDLVKHVAERLSARSQLRVVNLVGDPDSGQIGIAREVGSRMGLRSLTLDHRAFLASDCASLLGLLEREAILLGLLYYVDCDGLKAEELQSFRKGLDRFAAPLVVASRERLQGSHELIAIQVPRFDAAAQRETWKATLGECDGNVDALAEQFDFGPLAIVRAAAQAENLAALRGAGEPVTHEDLWQACCQQAAPQLENLAQKVVPCYDWTDIVVPKEVLSLLREIADQVSHRSVVYQDWGFGQKLSRGRGISALFAGASGVGKTMAAEVMARHLNLDLYRIDLAGIVSKYIGETEKNLRSVFDAAERSGAILFFDEADALFGKRSEVKDSHDRYANIEVNYLLQRMEDYRGLAILATNMKAALDSAFLRRLRFIVDFPFPSAVHRAEIWRRVFPPSAALDRLDFGVLARLEIPGGNIRNIAVNSAFLAAGEGVAIAMDHIMRAARREYAKMDRLVLDSEFGRYAGVRVQ